MRVDHLSSGYRTYASWRSPSPRAPGRRGDNATGKTNLLESILVLVTGRSHRASVDRSSSPGARFARLEALADGNTVEIVGGSHADRRRPQARQGQRRAAPPAGARAALRCPLRARGHAAHRRLARPAPRGDRHARGPAPCLPAATMSNYARAVTQRNNLLRSVRDGTADPAELRYWDGVVIEDGAQIVDWRRATLAAIAARWPMLTVRSRRARSRLSCAT